MGHNQENKDYPPVSSSMAGKSPNKMVLYRWKHQLQMVDFMLHDLLYQEWV